MRATNERAQTGLSENIFVDATRARAAIAERDRFLSIIDALTTALEAERGRVVDLEKNVKRLREMRSGIRNAVDRLVVDKCVVDEMEVAAIDRQISDLIDESIHYEIRQRPSLEPGADHAE